jgi:hypothetical protein
MSHTSDVFQTNNFVEKENFVKASFFFSSYIRRRVNFEQKPRLDSQYPASPDIRHPTFEFAGYPAKSVPVTGVFLLQIRSDLLIGAAQLITWKPL